MSVYLLVSGDFTPWGGMDRANYELAWYLAEHVGADVHLVSYNVTAPLVHHRKITWHRVPKPLHSYALAEPLLAWYGRRVAASLTAYAARVIVNGGNCAWGDVNWVHAVHAAWNTRCATAPRLFRLHAAWRKAMARYAERQALRQARVIIANSHRVRQQLIDDVGLSPARIHVVYYGVDPEAFCPVQSAARLAMRQGLGWQPSRPVVAFIGALGYDRNKGFDVLFDAWEVLCQDATWDADLVAVGRGAEAAMWQRRIRAAGLQGRVRMLGFTTQMADVLTASDALVSPTHYDAYGLGVHEALCCGLPAFVTRAAGVAERYPAALADLLLDDPPRVADVVQRLRRWRADMPAYRARLAPLSSRLRQRTWDDMSREVTDLLASHPLVSARTAA